MPLIAFRQLGPPVSLKYEVTSLHQYEVAIETGLWRNSGTSATVAFKVQGSNAGTGKIVIDNTMAVDRLFFSRGSVDKFIVTLPRWLGSLQYMRVWHDNSGPSPSWFLKRIVVRDLSNDHEYVFNCGQWLSLIDGDGRIERTLVVSYTNGTATFSDLLQIRLADGITDNHLWISVVAKSPVNHFTRVQRTTCCLSFLFAVMITNAMFYNLSAKVDETIQLGPLRFSWRQVVVGVQSCLIVVPINLLIVQLFRKSAQWKEQTEDSNCEYDNRSLGKLSYTKLPASKKTSILVLERLCLVIAYFLCFVVVIVAGTFTIFYSMFWGKELSNQWLASMLVSFVQDIFVMQPIKIVLLAVLVSYLVSKHGRRKWKRNHVSPTQSQIQLGKEFAASETDSKDCIFLSDDEKNKARNLAKKEKVFSSSAKEILLYIVFLSLICIVCYGDGSEHRFQMTKSVTDRIQVPGKVIINIQGFNC